MTRPETLFETASYELNKFRERRMAERRAVQRATLDRRIREERCETRSEEDDDSCAQDDLGRQ